jgi:hypothetical protein
VAYMKTSSSQEVNVPFNGKNTEGFNWKKIVKYSVLKYIFRKRQHTSIMYKKIEFYMGFLFPLVRKCSENSHRQHIEMCNQMFCSHRSSCQTLASAPKCPKRCPRGSLWWARPTGWHRKSSHGYPTAQR